MGKGAIIFEKHAVESGLGLFDEVWAESECILVNIHFVNSYRDKSKYNLIQLIF